MTIQLYYIDVDASVQEGGMSGDCLTERILPCSQQPDAVSDLFVPRAAHQCPIDNMSPPSIDGGWVGCKSRSQWKSCDAAPAKDLKMMPWGERRMSSL